MKKNNNINNKNNKNNNNNDKNNFNNRYVDSFLYFLQYTDI